MNSDRPAADITPADSIGAPVDRFGALTRTPRLTLTAVRVVREAAPRTFTLVVALQLAAAALIGLQLILVKHLIDGLLEISRSAHPSASSVAPQLAALVVATFLAGAATAILTNRQRLLGELVARMTVDR